MQYTNLSETKTSQVSGTYFPVWSGVDWKKCRYKVSTTHESSTSIPGIPTPRAKLVGIPSKNSNFNRSLIHVARILIRVTICSNGHLVKASKIYHRSKHSLSNFWPLASSCLSVISFGCSLVEGLYQFLVSLISYSFRGEEKITQLIRAGSTILSAEWSSIGFLQA